MTTRIPDVETVLELTDPSDLDRVLRHVLHSIPGADIVYRETDSVAAVLLYVTRLYEDQMKRAVALAMATPQMVRLTELGEPDLPKEEEDTSWHKNYVMCGDEITDLRWGRSKEGYQKSKCGNYEVYRDNTAGPGYWEYWLAYKGQSVGNWMDCQAEARARARSHALSPKELREDKGWPT